MESELDSARALLARGSNDEAIDLLRSLTSLHPKDARSWRELGKAFASVGRDREALDALTKSTWIIARDLETWILMAVLAHRLDRHKDAVSCWKSALETQPNLFQDRPHFAVLWCESRSHDNEFLNLARRLARRSDAGSCLLILDAVLDVGDIPLALEAVEQSGEQSTGLQAAKAALSLILGDVAGFKSLASLTRFESEELRASIWTRVFGRHARLADVAAARAVARSIGEATDFVVVQAAYRALPQESEAWVAATWRLAHSALASVRSANAAA